MMSSISIAPPSVIAGTAAGHAAHAFASAAIAELRRLGGVTFWNAIAGCRRKIGGRDQRRGLSRPMTDDFQRFDVHDALLINDGTKDDWTPVGTVADRNDWEVPARSYRQVVNGVALCLVFAAGETAAQPVLAIPALARALREVQLAGWAQCSVYVPAPWRPNGSVAAQVARLAPGLRVDYRESAPDPGSELIVQGEQLASHRALAAAARESLVSRRSGMLCEAAAAGPSLTIAEAQQLLRIKSRDLLAKAAKSGDGIVTRHLNRPVSQALTRLLLRWCGPVHPNAATAGTAIIAAGMFAILLSVPGHTGLVLGALLFQAASMFDGVDGEIARVTFRATLQGASLDSLVDAVTNILFFVGVITNLSSQGDHTTAAMGLTALGGLVFGTVMLGLHARRQRGVIDFNSVKQLVAPQQSRMMQALTWLTMRDFYAFAAAVLIGLGLVGPAVWAFSVVVAGWLVVVLSTLLFGSGKRFSRVVSRRLVAVQQRKSNLNQQNKAPYNI